MVVRQSFQAEWFKCHSWLHYDEGKDLALYYLCMQARMENKLASSKCADEASTTRGLANWKDAKICFAKHENSNCHKEAIQSIVRIPKH